MFLASGSLARVLRVHAVRDQVTPSLTHTLDDASDWIYSLEYSAET